MKNAYYLNGLGIGAIDDEVGEDHPNAEQFIREVITDMSDSRFGTDLGKSLMQARMNVQCRSRTAVLKNVFEYLIEVACC